MPLVRPGYVYIVTNPAWLGYVKIGAAKALEGRLADYQTASPLRDFKLEFAAHFTDRFAAEGRLKAALRGHRVRGTEWFHIHHDDARAALIKIQERHP